MRPDECTTFQMIYSFGSSTAIRPPLPRAITPELPVPQPVPIPNPLHVDAPSGQPTTTTTATTGSATTTTTGSSDTPAVVDSDELSHDFARPQGTWTEAHAAPSQSLSTKPLWALIDAGGGKKKYLPLGTKSVPTVSKKCAGVYECTNPQCHNVDRPGSLRKDNPPFRDCRTCRGILKLVQCNARWNIATVDGKKRYYHEGFHRHRLPPHRSFLPAAVTHAEQVLLKRPDITPAMFQTGHDAFDPSSPLYRAPAGEIDPKLTDPKAAGRLLRETRRELGMPNPKGKTTREDMKLLNEMSQVAENCTDTISDPQWNHGVFSFTVQLPSMRARIIKPPDLVESDRSIGRAGFVTDAHNTFFDGSFVLIQTVVFVDQASRWMSVLFSVVNTENARAYRRHFMALLQSFDSFPLRDIKDQFLHVVDFSAAQNRGFHEAWVEYSVSRRLKEEEEEASKDVIPTDEPEDDRKARRRKELERDAGAEADTLIRGCEFHFIQNIRRARIKLRIPDCDSNLFDTKMKNLFFKSKDLETVNRRREVILKAWPDVKVWLDWWTSPRIAKLIMDPDMTMSKEDREAVPNTSNAVEAAHSVLLKGSGGEKFALVPGVRKLLDYSRLLDTKERAAGSSRPLRLSLPLSGNQRYSHMRDER